ncbi:hypothetical protein CRG98_015869 [Punica granatum]|uniref:Auxin-responsive protein SAUR68-like n=1 Tax=Punica granatum TaxID=22663 RepID=A0A2I0K5E0_PUNGR|nr:hypothetical protein CRG98_015869 [Punica granatum]
MISPRKLIRIARKWQKAAALRRKRISFLEANGSEGKPSSSEEPCLAGKGNFVVYTVDQKQFEFPIKYLSNPIVMELLRLSEEEFSLSRDGPITLPCDITSMEHIISLIRGKKGGVISRDYKIIAASRCSLPTSFHQRQELLLCS